MDVKVGGITLPILRGALEKARVARLHILETLTTAIAMPRPTISPRAPEIIALTILPEQIGLVIGGGGKTINKINIERQNMTVPASPELTETKWIVMNGDV